MNFGTTAPYLYDLQRFLPQASYVGGGTIRFQNLCIRAADCLPGSLYVALSGSKFEEGRFLYEAGRQGASGVLTDFPLPDLSTPQCIVRDVRREHGKICQMIAGFPARNLNIWGVTGTNGKTTVTWMLRSILQASGKKTGLLGTILYDNSQTPPVPAQLTTPDAGTLAEWMAQMVKHGATDLTMEVSSHSIAQKRLSGISLKTAIITNITQDHLDYHASFEEYRNTKFGILDYCQTGSTVVVNGDDPVIKNWISSQTPSDFAQKECFQKERIQTVGFEQGNRFRIELVTLSLDGGELDLNLGGRKLRLLVPLPGLHNLLNAAQAAVSAHLQGIDDSSIVSGLKNLVSPPGRLQRVDLGQKFSCFVDFAHTPDAISQVLRSMRPLIEGRLICLFGAGGNRDREKRPEMARSALLADVIVLTSDNPRDEPIEQIFQEILSGFPENRKPEQIFEDRAEAITWACQTANAGDCLLILGKGHETTQQIGKETRHFDDVDQVTQTINSYCLPN